jgi:hypothetical protein
VPVVGVLVRIYRPRASVPVVTLNTRWSTTCSEPEAVLVVVMALVSVLMTDQVREPEVNPVWIEPETAVLACGATELVPEPRFVTERTPPEESAIARFEPPVGVELVIVPLAPTVVPTRALVTPPVVIVKVVD